MSPGIQALLAEALKDFSPDPASPLPPRVQRALALARRLQRRAGGLQTRAERRQQAELDRLLQNPADKATLVQMTDQAFRPHRAARVADQFTHILDVQGVPRCFSPLDRALLRGFQSFGGYLPEVAVPLVKDRMQRESANVVLPAERDVLTEHLRHRRAQGIRVNVNFLGEAILSEAEARRRLDQYLEAIQFAETEVFSVKISTLFSQISVLAREHTLGALCGRLEVLFRAAAAVRFTRADGEPVPKFIYLDMEEYRDLDLTAEAFMRTLDRPGLAGVSAGIVLQAYIPDSARMQWRLNGWARRRVAAGGASVTLRIVKGANLEMERAEASLHGWPQAPYCSKAETDANFKRMLHEGLRPENLAAVRLGVASHNLFDLAYAFVAAAEADAPDRVQFEMLEGMAAHQRRALGELEPNLLLYSPVCPREHFLSAIGYLIRRLDENTGPENFLRHAFRLEVDSPDWRRLEAAFLRSLQDESAVDDAPRRTQNRSQPPAAPAADADWRHFTNEPDTDWSLPQNSAWAGTVVERWQTRCGAAATEIMLVVDGAELQTGAAADRGLRECRDPSRPGVIVGRYPRAGAGDIHRALACATEDPDGWRTLSAAERRAVLRQAAHELRLARGDLMGAALANAGKTLAESDPEVSEAVDFAEFYAAAAEEFFHLPGLRAAGRGVVVVVSPWNFPIAIPCGGVAAALAAGNTVILKPSSDAVLAAWELCRCFWRAGVSRRTLQFLPCAGGTEGRALVNDPRVGAVVLTGGTATAQAMLRARPDLPLFAETGGKNATLVTALADREQAVKNVLHSAFSHAGQKCSATSLLLLEAEVHDDPEFKRMLVEAVQSLHTGSAWELQTKVPPLIRPPAGELLQALTTLEPGESWAVKPQPPGDNPHLWTPGVKWGVQPGSVTHLTEFFGPVLGVMRFTHLDEAISLVNQTGYGLTSGLESLDDREQARWRDAIRAGNLYLNRTTVGAVVLRQPFGGLGKSGFGPGLKAGGPNYVAQFMRFEENRRPRQSAEIGDPLLASLQRRLRERARHPDGLPADDLTRAAAAIASHDLRWREEFGREHDHFRLVGQDNVRRYRPAAAVQVRVHPDDTLFDTFARVCAARTVGARVVVSTPPGVWSPALSLLDTLTEDWAAAVEFVEETDAALAAAVLAGQVERLRYAARDRVPPEIWRAAAEAPGCAVLAEPVLMEGRVELLWPLHEQSVSHDYHRYGNLGARAGEARAAVA